MIDKILQLDSQEIYKGFCGLTKNTAKNLFKDGTESAIYHFEKVHLRLNCVIVALYGWPDKTVPPTKHNCVVALRKQIRPVISLEYPYIIECAGGGIDAEETILEAAKREVKEEMGLDVHCFRLGGPLLSSPGIIDEEVHFAAAELSPQNFEDLKTIVPRGDGSPLEDGPILFTQNLSEVLYNSRESILPQCMKVEIILRRLWDML